MKVPCAFYILFSSIVCVALLIFGSSKKRFDLLQYRDGLNTQADDLGWIPRRTAQSIVTASRRPPKQQISDSSYPLSGAQYQQNSYAPPSALARSYVTFGGRLKSNLMHVVHSLAQAKQSWRVEEGKGVNNAGMTEILKTLAAYAPLALEAQEQLSRAITTRGKIVIEPNPQTQRLQYGRVLQDEYDADTIYPPAPVDQYGVPTQARLHFNEKEIPTLKCGPMVDGKYPPYTPHLDRLGDCELSPQKSFNKMYSLDRLRSGAPPATPEQIHAHMQRVDKFVDKWKKLLVGDGGGDGPGSFDDPYYFCYDQYQEDPEFTQCLHDLAQDKKKGPFAVHKWVANDGRGETHSVMRKEEERVGFPELNKEWKKTLKPDDSGDWVRLNKESALTPDGASWVPLAEDSPAQGQIDAKHAAPFAGDNLPSPVDGVIGGA